MNVGSAYCDFDVLTSRHSVQIELRTELNRWYVWKDIICLNIYTYIMNTCTDLC